MAYIAIAFDTQTVVTNSFDFDGPLLSQLKHFKGSPVAVVVSDVTVREVETHLAIKIKEASSRLRSAQRDAVRFGLSEREVDREPTIDPASIAKERLTNFLKDIGAVIIPSKGISTSVVLARYSLSVLHSRPARTKNFLMPSRC